MNRDKTTHVPGITVRPLRESDLEEADRVMRVAFGTFDGLQEPERFMGEAGYVRTRWKANPEGAYCAERNGQIVGSNFATRWGSMGFVGPLSVRPDLWDLGIGKLLMEPILDLFALWQTKHAGLHTFAESPRHVGFYQKFGFWPRFLTAVMSRPVGPIARTSGWSRYSDLSAGEQEACLSACRDLTEAVYAGLDVGSEIKSIADQKLGDTLLLWGEAGLMGLAACHYGPGTEARDGSLYVKFGAVRPGPASAQAFNDLLGACEATAAGVGAKNLTAGVNTARHAAYNCLIEHGFRIDSLGIAMQRPNEDGYNRPDCYLIDDWR